ncbi:helix-turn-helix transcriptional regulator, partial [Amycolatopsis sp. NPDC047767]|uniref:helix-turn-helix domain-containing protein n=1 Tax=Amycolatopsis sp. NPDC047767 TaxID=3156765 RepID=UPI0034550480
MPELVTQGSRRLGGYLRELRDGCKKTLEEVATHLDQDKGTISRYEGGRLKPKWSVVVMLTNLYGATDEQAERVGAPPTFRTVGLIRSGLDWRMCNAGTAAEVFS